MHLSGLSMARYWAVTNLAVTKIHLQQLARYWRTLDQTRRMRDSQRGRCAFVFGCGPSVNKLDAEKIARLQRDEGFHLISLNSFINSDFGKTAIPDYYVLSDPAYWTRLPELPEHRKTWDLLADAKCPVFVPMDRFGKYPHEPQFAFCDLNNIFSRNVHDITRPVGLRPLTAYRALAIACYLGYRRIYIAGIDNDSFQKGYVDINNVKHGTYEHFYGDVFDLTSYESLADGLYYQAQTFKVLERFAGFPIVNLDPTGLVDCFTKHHRLDVYR